jgi:hypothetical protein
MEVEVEVVVAFTDKVVKVDRIVIPVVETDKVMGQVVEVEGVVKVVVEVVVAMVLLAIFKCFTLLKGVSIWLA